MAVDLSQDIVLRWEDQDPAFAPVLAEGGIDVVLVREPAPAFAKACRSTGMRVAPASEVAITDLAGFRKGGAGPAALSEGLWPGIGSELKMTDDDPDAVSGPSRQPWVDANGFRIPWLKAICPERYPALAYRPDAKAGLKPDRLVPYDTLELALAEAWVHGGNYVLAAEARYRAALLRRDPKALTSWRRLGRTARWLKKHRTLFGGPVLPAITLLVDEGEASVEIANLMMRQNASPALEPAGSPPAPDPERRAVVVAVSLTAAPPEDVRNRILAHAGAGSTVITDRGEGTPWWRAAELRLVRDEPDRETYELGRGKVVAYKKLIEDPSDFALDVIDVATHARRAVRIWWGPTAITTVNSGPDSGPFRAKAVLKAVNYGSPMPWELMMYAQGNYESALMLRPEADPLKLKTAKRGSSTELTLPDLRRVGVILLD
jgi:hypothetical protein